MNIFLFFPFVFSLNSEFQQQLIDDTLPVITLFSSEQSCFNSCRNLTDICLSAVNPLCTKECESVPNSVDCHHLCQNEGYTLLVIYPIHESFYRARDLWNG